MKHGSSNGYMIDIFAIDILCFSLHFALGGWSIAHICLRQLICDKGLQLVAFGIKMEHNGRKMVHWETFVKTKQF